VNPTLVACSFIASGLRVFDIRDVTKPKEVAYFVAPAQSRSENENQASNFAMSQPAFVPQRKEIWFTDGTSGFYALQVTNNAWPADAAVKGVKKKSAKKKRTARCRRAKRRRATARRAPAFVAKKRTCTRKQRR
jgi:hypothetical protein